MLWLGIFAIVVGIVIIFQFFTPLRILFFFIGVVLLSSGIIFVFKTSITSGLIVIATFVIWGIIYLFFGTTSSTLRIRVKGTRNAMYKTYYKIKKFSPVTNINMDEETKSMREKRILIQTLQARWPYSNKYALETLENIVDKYPDIESLTKFVILFEFFEHQYPENGIEELQEHVRDTLKMIKEHNIDIEYYVKNYGKYMWIGNDDR